MLSDESSRRDHNIQYGTLKAIVQFKNLMRYPNFSMQINSVSMKLLNKKTTFVKNVNLQKCMQVSRWKGPQKGLFRERIGTLLKEPISFAGFL